MNLAKSKIEEALKILPVTCTPELDRWQEHYDLIQSLLKEAILIIDQEEEARKKQTKVRFLPPLEALFRKVWKMFKH